MKTPLIRRRLSNEKLFKLWKGIGKKGKQNIALIGAKKNMNINSGLNTGKREKKLVCVVSMEFQDV